MNLRRTVRALWLLGGLALLLSLSDWNGFPPVRLGSPKTEQASWVDGAFQPNAVYPATQTDRLLRTLGNAGSFITGDEWQGSARTTWWNPVADFSVLVAGYPTIPGCGLWAEFRNADGQITRVRCEIENPRESWAVWRIILPINTVAVRLEAVDQATGAGGWLAFSEPFIQPKAYIRTAVMSVRTVATCALVLVLIWGPWLVWMHWHRNRRQDGSPLSLAAIATAAIGLGPALLAVLGVSVWVLGGVLHPIWFGGLAVAAIWVGLGLIFWRKNFDPNLSKTETRMLALCGMLAFATACKAAFSGGPEGELYGGTISRTLAVGDRSDSRIPYHVVQTVAYHLAPDSSEAERFFSPFTFFTRGPLSGLIAAPVVFATAGRPPRSMPDQRWEIFDSTGFAAYRITLMVLATTTVLALFFALRACTTEHLALSGAGLFALCPFTIHDTIFTWPKMPATACLILAFLWAHSKRPGIAGSALAAGYFFHPMVLLWTPWLALWAALSSAHDGSCSGLRRCFQSVKPMIFVGFALLAFVLPWMAAGSMTTHHGAEHVGQSSFLKYWTAADYRPATWSLWWESRWMNFSNTFVPFWLYLRNAAHPVLNSIQGPSTSLVKFSFLWWNTLPLGAGLLLWTAGMIALLATIRRDAKKALLLFVGPALVLTAYWGASPTGLLREAGHPLLVALVVLVTWHRARARSQTGSARWLRIWPFVQLPEAFLMLWLTTLLNPTRPLSAISSIDALWLALNVLTLVGAAAVVATSTKDDLTQEYAAPTLARTSA